MGRTPVRWIVLPVASRLRRCFAIDGQDVAAFDPLDRGCLDGGAQGGGELAGIDGVLGQAERGTVLQILNRGVGLKRNGDSRKCLDAVEEGWVALGAEAGEFEDLGRVVGVLGGQHAGGGGGGSGEASSAVDDGDGGSAIAQLEGRGEADQTGSQDDDVGAGAVGMCVQQTHSIDYPATADVSQAALCANRYIAFR